MPVLGQIWPFLGPKSNFWGAGSKNFGTLVSGFQWDIFFVLKNIDHWGSNWPLGAKNVLFWPQNLDIWGQKSIFCLVIAIFCWWNKWPLYPGLQLSHRNHPQKNFRVRARGHFFGAHPCFLAVFWPFPLLEGQLPLIFGPISTKLGGIVQVIKKMTQKDNRPGPGRNYGETGVFYVPPKSGFGPKNGSYPKK